MFSLGINISTTAMMHWVRLPILWPQILWKWDPHVVLMMMQWSEWKLYIFLYWD